MQPNYKKYDQNNSNYQFIKMQSMLQNLQFYPKQAYRKFQIDYQLNKVQIVKLSSNQMKTDKLLTCLVFILSISLTFIQAQPSTALGATVYTSRTDTLYKRCPQTRSTFYAAQTNESQSFGRQQTAASLQLNGDALIYDILTNDTAGATEQAKKSLGYSIIYVIFMVIGLAIMILCFPVLICCCCCPNSCPPCQSCRGGQTQPYTKCQITWPAACITFFSLIAIGASVAIIIINPQLQNGYSDSRCSTSMLIDDLLNGNYTQDNSSYFIGLTPLKYNLSSSSLAQSAPLSDNNGNSNGLELKNVVSEIKSIQISLADLSNDVDGSSLSLSYLSPLNSDSSHLPLISTTIQSTIPSALGNTNQPLSLIGQLNTKLSTLQSYISGSISNSVPSTRRRLQSSSSPSSLIMGRLLQIINPLAVNSSLAKYATLSDYVTQYDTDTDKTLQQGQDKYIGPVHIVTYVIAGIVILFSLVMLISTFCVCCSSNYAYRKGVYLSCIFLTFMGILLFILSLVASGVTAGTHYGCQYVEVALHNRSEFMYRMNPIFNNTALTNMVAQCATNDSNGIILNSTLSSSGLSEQYTTASLSELLRQITLAKDNLDNTLRSYINGEILDFSSSSDLQILNKLSDSSQYACSTPGFVGDSWVPSVNQGNVPYVHCKVSTNPQSSCSTITAVSSSECQGCIDTSKVSRLFSGKEQFVQSLDSKYSVADCQAFIKDLANVWANYYNKKSTTLSPVLINFQNISNQIDNLITSVSSLSFPNTSTRRRMLVAYVTQLNCKVIGEDIKLVLNTFCTKIFNYGFAMRIVSIIGSFSLLMIMFCATCLGMRAFKNENFEAAPASPKTKDSAEVRFYESEIDLQTKNGRKSNRR